MTALTPANQLTLLRMLLIPAFVILIVYGEMGWALLAFLIAGITDALDGLIARWTGQKTTLGAWLDPTRLVTGSEAQDVVSRLERLAGTSARGAARR